MVEGHIVKTAEDDMAETTTKRLSLRAQRPLLDAINAVSRNTAAYQEP